MWIVYLLQHSATAERYIGLTADIERRLKEHNSPRNRDSTHRVNGEWRMRYCEMYLDRDDAAVREMRLKRHGRAKQELLKRVARCLL